MPQIEPWQPAGSGLAGGLLTRGGAPLESIENAEAALGASLPPSLAGFIKRADAAEGWVAGEYLALWPIGEMAGLNRLARVSEFAPRLVAFATNGGLEGYFFDKSDGSFINSPMIGLGYVEQTSVGRTFDEFLHWLAESIPAAGRPPVADPDRFGLVIHEITPIIFGGSPTDPKNKTLLPLAKYAEAVGWWNEQVRRAKDD